MLSRQDNGNAMLAGILAYIFCAVCSPCSTPQRGPLLAYHARRTSVRRLHTFAGFVPTKRIKFKRATLTFRCLQDSALRYLSADFILVADAPSRRRLRSTSSNDLIVRPSPLVTVGDYAFPVAGANPWNGLLDELISLPYQFSLWRQLKTLLFRSS